MKNQIIGRQELLTWINEFTECDYPKVELLSDAVGFIQVIDAIHPGQVNLSKINFMARFPEDCGRNLKILDDVFTKLNIEKVLKTEKLSCGKFQENMTFIQWLFNYAAKNGPFALKSYKGYQRRLDAFQHQQHGRYLQMSAHLIPNTEFLRFKHNQYNTNNDQESGVSYSSISQLGTTSQQSNQKLQYLDGLEQELESDIKNRMEYNWKLIYALDDMVYQRDVLFGILAQIDKCVSTSRDKSTIGDKILDIIQELPEDFQPNK